MFILASASPRRQELLRLVVPAFSVEARDTDESLPEGIPPDKAVRMLALRKAGVVAADFPEAMVLGADTVVTVDGRFLGKPRDAVQAREMLHALSGRVHRVHTGVAVIGPGIERVFSEKTEVEFAELSDGQIERYVATGEPFDKAGAYGIQGYGALFVKGIRGDYYNVMGLPVCRLYEELGQLGGGLSL